MQNSALPRASFQPAHSPPDRDVQNDHVERSLRIQRRLVYRHGRFAVGRCFRFVTQDFEKFGEKGPE